MERSLEGYVVIITGASKGIGAAAAHALARRGCRLILAARSSDRLQALAHDLGPCATPVPTDITIADDVRRLAAQTLDRHGRIDALLANAGIYIPGPFEQGDPDAFAQLLDVNINGVLRCVHAVLPAMLQQKAGDILVTSSISGHVDIHWEPVYSASKHAIQSFVHTLRRQVAPSGIRVGAVAPGMVANELWGITRETDIERLVNDRAALRSEDVAEAILFMLTRPAHITIRDLVMLPQNQDL